MSDTDRILAAARAELGYRESPKGSNSTKYGRAYGINPAPWCAMFTWWCYRQGAGIDMRRTITSSFASCEAALQAFRAKGLTVGTPQPGDIVIYQFDRDRAADHMGIFESGNRSQFVAIEGNTSGSSVSNGGQVMRRGRFGGQVLGFCRPIKSQQVTQPPKPQAPPPPAGSPAPKFFAVLAWAIAVAKTQTLKLGDKGDAVRVLQYGLAAAKITISIDGSFGPHTDDCVKFFQAMRHLVPDGVVGPATWQAIYP